MNRKKQQVECVRIDCEKFRDAIENHGYTARDLGLKIGYSQGYFWGFTSGARDLLPVRVVTLLDLVGIHLNEYEYTEPEPEPQDDPLPWDVADFADKLLKAPSEVVLTGESIEELVKAFRSMFYEETKKAFEEVLAK